MGGEGLIGHRHSEEAKQKMSAGNMGRRHTEEAKRKMGFVHSEESRRKMSMAAKKRIISGKISVSRLITIGHQSILATAGTVLEQIPSKGVLRRL